MHHTYQFLILMRKFDLEFPKPLSLLPCLLSLRVFEIRYNVMIPYFSGLVYKYKTGKVLCVGGEPKESRRDKNRVQNREREMRCAEGVVR